MNLVVLLFSDRKLFIRRLKTDTFAFFLLSSFVVEYADSSNQREFFDSLG